ncbi:MAG: protein kinase, partial [Acidobacteriota bacterium]|nr:protein kinase [Acidobacteriota bacterium]
LTAGTLLGRYEIRSLLGAGGMGEVYLALDTTELERMVAVKVLPADLAADPERMRRFVQEAKTASSLNHPNIITIHEIGEVDSSRFIVTEFVEGETLRQKMTLSRFTLREALDVGVQIASALVAAHKAGVVHRDIKPENVMLREDGILKVLDFGLAKPTGRPTNQPAVDYEAATRALVNTTPGTVMGTVSYMSPEQARGLEVDERTDIWSLGVVLYEMVSGRLPFEGETATDVLAVILHREPASLLLHRRDVPEELERIVEKALTKNREERYQLAKDLGVDLKRLRQRLDVEAEIERSVTPERNAEERHVATGGGHPAAGIDYHAAAQTGGGHHTTSSAEYVVTEIRRHKRGALLVLAALIAVTSAVAYFAYLPHFVGGGGEGIRSIAVLPFANESGNADVEYLSDGMTETLISSLSQLPNLSVKARSSVFRYKGKETNPQTIGKELNVHAILNGRVLQRGDDLTLFLSLVDATTENNIWSKQYNRKLTNLVTLQTEIARDVSNNLKTKLSGADEEKLTKNYTENTQAYRLYLQGRFHWNKRTPQDLQKAIEYFEQSIAVDPNYALSFAGIADSYSMLGNMNVLSSLEAYPKAKAIAKKALEIDDGIAEAHTSLAWVLQTYEWDWSGAEREYKRAIELNPNYATAHQWYAEFLMAMGRHQDALDEIHRAKELDPLSLIINAVEGWVLYHARDYDRSIEQYRKTIELEPRFPLLWDFLARIYEQKEDYENAIAAHRKSIELEGGSAVEQDALKEAYTKFGVKGYWQKRLELLQKLEEVRATQFYCMVKIHALLGDKDKAFALLENSYQQREYSIINIKVSPDFDGLRSDPRFSDLMRRVGLP